MEQSLIPRILHSFVAGQKKYGLIIYLFLTTIVIFVAFSHWGYDDPYITYRYAVNISHGLGFVYNPAERVLSTTTPLFTLILALLGLFWTDLPHLAILIGSFSLALGGLFLWDLAQTWQTPMVGWTALLLYPLFPMIVSTLGSETPLYLAFCLGTFAFYARKRYLLVAVFVSLAILARPDGILIAFILPAHFLLLERRSIPWRTLILFLALTMPWFVFSWIYFGSPFPATLAVKQHQGAMAISQRFAPGFLTLLESYAKWPYYLEAGLAVIGILFMVWRGRAWSLFLIWTITYFLAFSALGVSSYFWYYPPLLPGFVVLIGLGINFILKIFDITQTQPINNDEEHMHSSLVFGRKRRSYFIISNFLIGAILLLFASAQGQYLWNMRQHPDTRIRIYPAIGEWLLNQSPTNASVATLEVGLIGYYSHRRMIDFAGLIEPQVSDRLSTNTTYEDAALWAVENFHPDYLVLHQNLFPRLEKGYADQHCIPIQRFPGVDYGYSMDLIIYSCK
jgi:hypothetical protein